MSETPGSSGGSSAYPGPGDAAQPPPYGQPSTPPAYGQGQPPAYPGQQPPAYVQGQPAPAYGQGQQSPPYGSTDPNSYLGPPSYPAAGYGMPPPPPGYEAAQSGWSGLAIAAFVVSFLPLIGILAAVPLAIVALVKIAKSSQRGKGLAIAAIIISVLWWVAFIAFAVWFAGQTVERNDAGEITKEGRIAFGDIAVGDCVSIPDPGGTGDVNTFDLKGVPCSVAHNAQAVAITAIDGESYPGEASLNSQSLRPCAAALTTQVRGAVVGQGSYVSYRLIPTEGIWDDDGGHRVICFVIRDGFGDITGSLTD